MFFLETNLHFVTRVIQTPTDGGRLIPEVAQLQIGFPDNVALAEASQNLQDFTSTFAIGFFLVEGDPLIPALIANKQPVITFNKAPTLIDIIKLVVPVFATAETLLVLRQNKPLWQGNIQEILKASMVEVIQNEKG